MLLRANGAAAGQAGPLPPEEVKLYAQKAAAQIHPWADLIDVCKIVDAKAKLPGLVLNAGRLRQAVCDELEAQQPALEETYRRRRIRQQRLIEQAVREHAAEKRKMTAVSRRAAAQAQSIIPVSGTETRKRTRDEVEQQLRDTEAEQRKLRERGAPEKPAGVKPRRLSQRGPWNDRMRAYKRHAQRVDELSQRRDALQQQLDKIGMSRAMLRQEVDNYLPPPAGAHAIVPRSPPMTGGSKPYSAEASYADTVYESGREQAAQEPERLRCKIREECAAEGQFPALAPYCGLPEVDPLAHYRLTLRHTRQMVEDLVSGHQADKGRIKPQTAQAERNQMIAMTDGEDGEDYLLWGRTQRLRLERLKKFEEEQQRAHAEKQLRHRGQRLVDLENAAERLESEPLKKGCKAWRVQQALLLHGPQTIVASASQAAPIAAALSDRYSVQIWVPDDDPRPGASHSAADCSWNLERDMLDRLYPNPNGQPRSGKTEGCRHRATLKRKMEGEMQSCPVAVIIAASKPLSKAQYRTAMALQAQCGFAVIVCDPAAAEVAAAGGLENYVKSQGRRVRKGAAAKKRKAGASAAAGRLTEQQQAARAAAAQAEIEEAEAKAVAEYESL